jgi:NADPH:quinone reductase-like Zn-dependent oxidoreductase
MEAVVRNTYGLSSVLRIEDVEVPTAGEGHVLVRVRAVSVNPAEWYAMTGTPYVARLDGGIRVPKTNRLGADFAGVVEAVGPAVTQFAPGDEVFGGKPGAFAEFVTVPQDGPIVAKPANVTFEQAAAVPTAGTTALHGLRDKGGVRAGQNVLINGASGGVGTFAVQIAKA